MMETPSQMRWFQWHNRFERIFFRELLIKNPDAKLDLEIFFSHKTTRTSISVSIFANFNMSKLNEKLKPREL